MAGAFRSLVLPCVAVGLLVYGSARSGAAQAPAKKCIEAFRPGVDYFPDKAIVEDAGTFTIEYHQFYKVVRVSEAYPGGPPEKYVLVHCGAPAPRLDGELSGAQAVSVPVTSLFSASTTHLSLLLDLGRLDALTGVWQLSQLTGEALIARAKSGAVREFAPISVIDSELVVSQHPDLFMTGGSPSPSLAVIRNAGVPVVANVEYLEPTALGRAEWLKYVAVFLNEERKAQSLYAAMKGRYRDLSARATAQPEATRPLVMTGRSSRGNFVIAGGRSYVAALIRDAGGRYAWADNPSVGSATVDLETNIRRAANADIWINGGGWRDMDAMLEDEPRYAEFKAYRQGQVWVYERKAAPSGANEYWLRSVSRPDLVLADLVKIFHPALEADRVFEWYMKVPARR